MARLGKDFYKTEPVMDSPETTTALAQVAHNAGDRIDEAVAAVRCVARRNAEFTSDDVWEWLGGCDTHEARAMGPVMRRAAKMGYCKKTTNTIPSKDPTCHGRDKRVWRSLLLEEFKLQP